MHYQTIVLSVLAVAATAAPRGRRSPWGAGSSWFNELASNIFYPDSILSPPTCDISNIQIPSDGTLPGPDSGLVVHHVALGRGTQNYTCDTTNSTAVPVAAGALATLFNVTCWTAMWPLVIEAAPSIAVHLATDALEELNPWGLSITGHHYFADATTPFFDLNTSNGQFGVAPCAKNASAIAPTNAAKGLGGEQAVAWLKLNAVNGATDGIKNVFRTSTAGGSPPATCQGQPANIEVQYSALYWYFSSASGQ